MFRLTAHLSRLLARVLGPVLEPEFAQLRRNAERYDQAHSKERKEAAEGLAKLRVSVAAVLDELARHDAGQKRLEETAADTRGRIAGLVTQVEEDLLAQLKEVHHRQVAGDRKILTTLAAVRAELGALPTRTWMAAHSGLVDVTRSSDVEFASQVRGELAARADADWEQRFAYLRAIEDGLRTEAKVRDEHAERFLACLREIRESEAEQFLRAAAPAVQVPTKATLRTVDDKVLRGSLLESLENKRERYVEQAIHDGAVRWESPLPREARYGEGLDERVIELPLAWEFIRLNSPGRVLDAGAALNLRVVRRAARKLEGSILHVTQSGANELELFEGNRYSYLFDDLRALSLKSETFDRVVCLSTLEHVGMNNARYGAADEGDPTAFLAALQELLRVTTTGGEVLVTVPYGRAENAGWYQVFDARGVERMTALPGVAASRTRIFHYCGCWHDATDTFDQPASNAAGWEQAITGVAVVRMTRG